jgi:hypothetical protein
MGYFQIYPQLARILDFGDQNRGDPKCKVSGLWGIRIDDHGSLLQGRGVEGSRATKRGRPEEVVCWNNKPLLLTRSPHRQAGRPHEQATRTVVSYAAEENGS